MPKSKIKTLALLVALPFFLTACTLQDLPVIGSMFGGSKGPVELTMWGLWEKSFVYDALLQKYQVDYPNTTLNFQDMSVLNLNGLVEYKKRVFARLEQNSWDADVVMVHSSWVPRLVAAGLISPMPSDLISTGAYSQLFYPVATETSVFNNQVYAVPAYYDGLVLVYNMDHFEEAGITRAPTAWEEFRRVAIDLTQTADGVSNSDIIRAGAAVGSADNINHFSDILGLMWAQAGVNFPQDIDSRAAQDAFAFYVNLMEEHKVWRADFPEATTAFVNGQVSMIFVPTWQVLDILAANPSMNLGVAPVPQALPNNPVAWGTFWSYVVPSNSDSQKAAWNFINFLTTEDSLQLLNREASKTREFGTPYALVSLQGDQINNPYLTAVLQTAPYATTSEIAARSGNAYQEEVIAAAINKYLSREGSTSITVENVLTEAKTALSSN
jgi:ABC-type glycerol-3-phosphate transport system substrate-binding protein